MSNPVWQNIFIMRMRYDEGLDSEEIANYENKHDITPNRQPRTNYDELWNVSGYYNDDEGNDIRDRDQNMNNDFREIDFCIWIVIGWIVITLATGIYIETL